MGTFGAPVTDSPNEDTQLSQQADPSPQEVIDPNDPALISEELNVNLDADAYAQPAPPPDGKYRVKLKLAQKKDSQGQLVDFVPAIWGKKIPQKIYVIGVEAMILDPSGKYDGLKAYDYNVSTFLGRDNATKVSTIVSKLRQPNGERWTQPNQKLTQRGWIELLVKALAGEPEAGIETAWEYSCQACGEEAKKKGESYPRSVLGMHKFPPETDQTKRKNGQLFSPEMKCAAHPAHGYGRARITINRFLSLDELKK